MKGRCFIGAPKNGPVSKRYATTDDLSDVQSHIITLAMLYERWTLSVGEGDRYSGTRQL
jgi:hypothetical protein